MNIVILSNGPGNYSTKRLKEEAKTRGHNVRVVKHKECYASIESSNPYVTYRGEDLRNVDAIIPRIGSNITRYGTAIVRQFEMQGVYTTATSIAITRSRDKLRSLQLLSRSGVGIPKTVFSRNTADIDDLIEEIGGLPVIIKLARGTHGNGVVLAETKKAAKSVLQALYLNNEDGTNILLQEFVHESAGEDIRAFVVGGRVVASVRRQSLDDDFRSNTHQGGTPTAIKLTDEEKKTAIKAAKTMGLPICGVDMMRSSRGPLVLEVNSSASLKAVETVTGRNVASKVIDYIEINAKRKNKKDKVGA
ncbi:RimK family alpha-L-glutamate ligase [Candidatus Nomurabacteria bacterium]|jgi:ribosomal protein S6--L-glutamate ligase|nr:RimK family alpha-L-glutamate ligase [Candidatus Saccharibacteria bacterium]MCA9312912.1 RimK family alpha-L-glutamate ligase [Candidatus Saccharibacteria bacterium]MCB9822056.1 RimK family alpha-L-glutamate ligase [Candidatus Nomurabacteria bacterium]